METKLLNVQTRELVSPVGLIVVFNTACFVTARYGNITSDGDDNSTIIDIRHGKSYFISHRSAPSLAMTTLNTRPRLAKR
jgi:hypothetical protein